MRLTNDDDRPNKKIKAISLGNRAAFPVNYEKKNVLTVNPPHLFRLLRSGNGVVGCVFFVIFRESLGHKMGQRGGDPNPDGFIVSRG